MGFTPIYLASRDEEFPLALQTRLPAAADGVLVLIRTGLECAGPCVSRLCPARNSHIPRHVECDGGCGVFRR